MPAGEFVAKLDWKPVEIEDKPLIDRYLKHAVDGISELNFTNLFLWQEGQDIRFCETDGFLVIRNHDNNQDPAVFMPIGEGDLGGILEKLHSDFLPDGYHLRSLTESMTERIQEAAPGAYEFVPSPEYSDYIYLTTDLIELAGKKYHAKKNLINRFMRTHMYEYHPLTHRNGDKVISLQVEWCRQNLCEFYPQLDRERKGILTILQHFSDMDYTGAYLEVEGRAVAFTIGELIAPDTVVIHIEKANSLFKGAYQMINQLFLKNEWSDTTWVNRECDLGIDGLRKAKESYRPHHLLHKFRGNPQR